jgi:hypothetical protein
MTNQQLVRGTPCVPLTNVRATAPFSHGVR